MNRGGVGARSLNIEPRAALNPVGDKRVERFGWTFAPRDKVMQIENDYDRDVYNGDIGIIEDVDLDEGEVAVNFDGRTLSFVFGELDTLVAPAYAVTIHKSQGSEYPAVVIPAMTQHYAMPQRNLIYTGVTRGKKPVVLVGQKKTVAIAVKNISGRKRSSKLDEWLAAAWHIRQACPWQNQGCGPRLGRVACELRERRTIHGHVPGRRSPPNHRGAGRSGRVLPGHEDEVRRRDPREGQNHGDLQ